MALFLELHEFLNIFCYRPGYFFAIIETNRVNGWALHENKDLKKKIIRDRGEVSITQTIGSICK